MRYRLLFIAILVVASGVFSFASEVEVREVKVTRSERVCSSSDDCKYLIFTDIGDLNGCYGVIITPSGDIETINEERMKKMALFLDEKYLR